MSLLKEGLPVVIGGVAAATYMRLDNLMLGWFLGENGVGEYAVSYRMTESFLLVFSSFSLSVYSCLSQSSKSLDFAEIRKTMFKLLITVIVVS